MTSRIQESLLDVVLSKEALKSNDAIIKSYHYYKRISDLTERTNIALGRKPSFLIHNTSTCNNIEINHNAISSTTKI